jgi:ABC-type microcin C transport system permease subunit YejE
MQRATTSRRRRRSPSLSTLLTHAVRDLQRAATALTALASALETQGLTPPVRDALGHLIARAQNHQTHLWLTLASVSTLA